jgi:hypothetical protein
VSLDEAGRRLIAERNGIQLGATKLSAEDTALLAHMQTNRQARAVLGIVAKQLQSAYVLAAKTAISHPAQYALPGASVAAATKSRLDNTARYAMKTYATIPDDDAPLSPLNRRRVEESLREARAAFADIGDDAADADRGLTGLLADLLTGLLPSWLRPTDPKKRTWILYAGVGAAVLVGLFIAGKLIHTIVLGRSQIGTLGAAEAAAVALMDAQRRRRRAARHGS